MTFYKPIHSPGSCPIINLSQFKLSNNHIKLLSKGLKFIPSQDLDTKSTNLGDLDIRLRRLAFFSNSHPSHLQDNSIEPLPQALNSRAQPIPSLEDKLLRLKFPSDFCPNDQQTHPAIHSFISNCTTDLNNLIKSIPPTKPNISHEERLALNQLASNPDIVIKSADKGSSIVVLDRSSYEMMAKAQLSNTKFYSPELFIPDKSKTLHSILNEMYNSNLISETQLRYLWPPNDAKLRTLYFLPKIHKPLEAWVNKRSPKGRPIVSDLQSDTYRISKLIDLILQPFSNVHNSYIKDTSDFLNKLAQIDVPEDCVLFSLDIESLYTNIDVDFALEAVRLAFLQKPDPIQPYIIKLLEFSLKNNYFMFNNELFRQAFGFSMGKSWAPELADIFLAYWEKLALAKSLVKPLFYFRFLDDICGAVQGTHKEFDILFEALNSQFPFIKLTKSTSHTSIDFLDVTISKGQHFRLTGRLDTRLYTKPTDTRELLHPSSQHPSHTFKSIAYAQSLRFRRISTLTLEYEKAKSDLFKTLKTQGYSRRTLMKANHSLTSKSLTRTPLPHHSNKHNCQICPRMFALSYTQLSRMIHWTSLPNKPNPECTNDPAIYIILCPKGHFAYVGQSIHFHNRMSNHLSDIRLDKQTTVANHFSKCNMKPLMSILQTFEPNSETLSTTLNTQETFWINNLHMTHPLSNPIIPRSNNIIPVILPFHQGLEIFSKNLHHQFSTLSSELPYLSNTNLISSYKRRRNIKDFLISSSHPPHKRRKLNPLIRPKLKKPSPSLSPPPPPPTPQNPPPPRG